MAMTPQQLKAQKVALAVTLPGVVLDRGDAVPKLIGRHEDFLIVSGLFLKVVIANHLATHIVDDVFAAPDRHSSLEVLVAIYGYAVQIFADFCGYTNIAIGVALLLGFEFPQNFNSPYSADSLRDFWRHWHMSLSSWLLDYVYIPLGGSRVSVPRVYANLLVTMFISGRDTQLWWRPGRLDIIVSGFTRSMPGGWR